MSGGWVSIITESYFGSLFISMTSVLYNMHWLLEKFITLSWRERVTPDCTGSKWKPFVRQLQVWPRYVVQAMWRSLDESSYVDQRIRLCVMGHAIIHQLCGSQAMLPQVKILKGLWIGGDWELKWPNIWIPYVFLLLGTIFQLCIFSGYRENTSLVFAAEIGIPSCSWCHTSEIRGGCNGNLYERVSAGKLLLVTKM